MFARASIMVGLLLLVTTSAEAEDHRYRRQAARAAIDEMEGDMVRLRTQALNTHGPAAALALCKTVAPTLAAAKRASMDAIDVTRTGRHVLNPANAPDPWERKVLDDFATRAAKGGSVAALEFDQAVDIAGGARMYRFMRAIVADTTCSACHGLSVSAEVAHGRSELYPDARAASWREGELAGAFSVRQPM